jgi:putative ATPase
MHPLADRVRPKTLAEFVGQTHLVGKGKPIQLMVVRNEPFSMIFWGPPGVGKTTLAKIIAESTGYHFVYLSAVSAGKKDIKAIIDLAQNPQGLPMANLRGSNKQLRGYDANRGTMLFLDEIHRFNKAQQDFLLPYVENGTLLLIGATTENPSFEVISPLLSRCHVFVLNELSVDELSQVIDLGLKELPRVKLNPEAKEYIITYANGDARKALNLLENTVSLAALGRGNRAPTITLPMVKNALQSAYLRYDKGGEEHYNTISAFIKSMRASNVDAALYYLARMVSAGEDPLFIARRMVVFASEDVGLAQPTALVVANDVFRACETIGYPECQENLAAGTVYLSLAKKDRSAYEAYMKALGDVQTYGNLPIPMEIRNAPTKLMETLGYGKGYDKYTTKSLLPEKLKGKHYFDISKRK